MNSWVKLKDIAHVLNGYAFKSNNYVQNGIRIIRITNVQKGYIEDNDPKFYPIEALEEVKGFRLYENDLLMSLTGNVGRVALLRKEMLPAALNQRVACIRIKEGAQVKKEFLYHFMNSDVFELKCIESANGVAQKNLSTEWLKEFRLYLPSIEKQGIITKVLDHLSDLITREKQQLKDLDLLIKSRFIEMFGEISVNIKHWKESRLEDLIIGKASNGFFAKPDKYSNDGKIGVICVGDVVNRKYSNINNLRRINMDEVSFKKYKVTYGDMLFCRSSLVKEGIAKASIVPKNSENAVFECHVIRIKLNTSIIVPEYMQAFSTTDYFRNQMIRMSKTATMTTIGQKDIISSSVLVPPIDIQNQFVDFMAQVDKSKLAVQKSLNELETLKKSLMQQYFG